LDRSGDVLLSQALAVVASVTSIALALVVGYDRAKAVYWDWVVRKLSPEEYAWAAAQFAPGSKSGVHALPPNATLDSGPTASKYGMFDQAIAHLRRRKWYRGRLVTWRQSTVPDASGKHVWLCLLHPEIYRRTRSDNSGVVVYR